MPSDPLDSSNLREDDVTPLDSSRVAALPDEMPDAPESALPTPEKGLAEVPKKGVEARLGDKVGKPGFIEEAGKWYRKTKLNIVGYFENRLAKGVRLYDDMIKDEVDKFNLRHEKVSADLAKVNTELGLAKKPEDMPAFQADKKAFDRRVEGFTKTKNLLDHWRGWLKGPVERMRGDIVRRIAEKEVLSQEALAAAETNKAGLVAAKADLSRSKAQVEQSFQAINNAIDGVEDPGIRENLRESFKRRIDALSGKIVEMTKKENELASEILVVDGKITTAKKDLELYAQERKALEVVEPKDKATAEAAPAPTVISPEPAPVIPPAPEPPPAPSIFSVAAADESLPKPIRERMKKYGEKMSGFDLAMSKADEIFRKLDEQGKEEDVQAKAWRATVAPPASPESIAAPVSTPEVTQEKKELSHAKALVSQWNEFADSYGMTHLRFAEPADDEELSTLDDVMRFIGQADPSDPATLAKANSLDPAVLDEYNGELAQWFPVFQKEYGDKLPPDPDAQPEQQEQQEQRELSKAKRLVEEWNTFIDDSSSRREPLSHLKLQAPPIDFDLENRSQVRAFLRDATFVDPEVEAIFDGTSTLPDDEQEQRLKAYKQQRRDLYKKFESEYEDILPE